MEARCGPKQRSKLNWRLPGIFVKTNLAEVYFTDISRFNLMLALNHGSSTIASTAVVVDAAKYNEIRIHLFQS